MNRYLLGWLVLATLAILGISFLLFSKPIESHVQFAGYAMTSAAVPDGFRLDKEVVVDLPDDLRVTVSGIRKETVTSAPNELTFHVEASIRTALLASPPSIEAFQRIVLSQSEAQVRTAINQEIAAAGLAILPNTLSAR